MLYFNKKMLSYIKISYFKLLAFLVLFLLCTLFNTHAMAQCNINAKVIHIGCLGNNTEGAIYIEPIGVPPFRYLWNGGERWQHLKKLQPGTYTIKVTDANGCTVRRSFTIDRLAPIEVTVKQTYDRNIELKVVNGRPPYEINAINVEKSERTPVYGQNAQLLPGQYVIIVTDRLGCRTSQNINIE